MTDKQWEPIISEQRRVTDRLKVYGGWLVCDWCGTGDSGTQAMVFIPDPKHEWVIDDE